jgi:hypothetical protein
MRVIEEAPNLKLQIQSRGIKAERCLRQKYEETGRVQKKNSADKYGVLIFLP